MDNPFKKDSGVNPQKENGHREISNPCFQALIGGKLSGSELALALAVIDHTWGYGKKSDLVSLSQFQADTGLSRPRVNLALRMLEGKRIIIVARIGQGKLNEYMFNKHYDTWKTPLTSKLELTSKQELTSKLELTTTSEQELTATSKLPATILKKERKKKVTKGRSERSPAFIQGMKDVFDGYRGRLGYPIPSGGADAQAIAWMLDHGYIKDQILNAYDALKKQPFWNDKPLNMQIVKKYIGEILKGSRSGLPTSDELKKSWGR